MHRKTSYSGDTALRENPHAHPVSPRDTHAAHLVSEVKYSTSTTPPGDVVRTAYPGISDDVKTVIPSTENPFNRESLQQSMFPINYWVFRHWAFR